MKLLKKNQILTESAINRIQLESRIALTIGGITTVVFSAILLLLL